MLPEVETLEHHAEPTADALDLAMVDGRQIAFPTRFQPYLLAGDEDAATRGQLEQIDAAQQRALAGTGGADDGQDIAFPCRERDAAQHLERTEALMQVLDADGLGRLGRDSAVALVT